MQSDPAAQPPLLEARSVSRHFGALAAVSEITVMVQRGQRWAVIGPNGAGKTTLFRVIAGEHLPTGGSLALFGQDMTRASQQRRARAGLARTYQISNLFADLTAQENVVIAAQAQASRRYQFWRTPTLRGETRERVEHALEQAGVTHVRNRQVRELSHGEQRQLELAIALAQEPKLLLLDEPAAGLSAAERVVMARLVRELPADLGLILIEHDMPLALGLVEQVLVMDNGTQVATGTPDEIRANELVQSIYLRT